jgi:hypothetical protein
MPVDTSSLFAQVIQDHLELAHRNADLEDTMPIGRYKSADPFENHPLFKTEEQARLEETMDGVPAFPVEDITLAWPGEESLAVVGEPEADGLWSRSRDFDWGD